MKINKLLVLIVFIGAPILANILSIMGFIYIKPIMKTFGVDDTNVFRDFQLSMPLLIIITIFLYVIIMIIYIWPILRINKNAKTAKKRILNAPLIASLIGMIGWLIFFIERLAMVLINKLEIKNTFFWSNGMNILFGIFCFVMIYYSLEFINRRLFIPKVFTKSKLSQCKGAINLSIKTRFFIQYISICIFPLVVFFTFIYLFLANNNMYNVIANVAIVAGAIGILGMVITYLIARSYQAPISKMKLAADRIRVGFYDVTIPVVSSDELGNLGETLNEMSRELKEKEFIKETFGKAVDPKVRDYMLKGNVELGGEIKQATIMFSDIRGFTSIAENMRADKIVNLLNIYFEKMSICITDEKGLVNKFIGDALMAVFGVPIAIKSHPRAAIIAAINMRRELDYLNLELKKQGLPEIDNGIGIHTGEVLSGNIGSSSRMEYTVIGDSVNVASRIEMITKSLKIPVIVSDSVIKGVDDLSDIRYREIDSVQVPGRNKPVVLFEVFNSDPDEVVDKKLNINSILQKGLSFYKAGGFLEAKQIFLQCKKRCPMDVIPEIYIQRCKNLIKNPPGPEWSGITVVDK